METGRDSGERFRPKRVDLCCPLQERDHATILPVIRHDDVDTRIDNLFAWND
jgi:hypothetical protein